MKLRARKTRVVFDVKPERFKVKLEIEASMALPANDSQQQVLISDSGNVKIKQEQDVYLTQMDKQLKRDINENDTFSDTDIKQEKTTQSSSVLQQKGKCSRHCVSIHKF